MEINEKKTKMVSESKVKVKLMRDAMIENEVRLAGSVVEVPEEHAEELCRPVLGLHTHAGYRPNSQVSRANMARGVRL